MAAMSTAWIRHPGSYIKEEMEARGWLQRDLAFILGCPEQAVNMILSGKRGISPDMANAFGEAFDVSPEFFANLQKAYDLAHAKAPDPSVAVRRDMQNTYPVREMIKRGWIELSDAATLETQLVRFFRVGGPTEIPYMAHVAKKTEDDDVRVKAAQLAWLFRVRQIAEGITVSPYSEKALIKALDDLQSLLQEPEGVRHVPKILAACGVRFVLVEKLPNAKIDGVCFWLDDARPIIGMTLRFDRINNFWFVLRHEIEHVLQRHGREEAVVDSELEGERASTSESLPESERVANAAAARFCVPIEKLDSFMARKHPFYYEKDVVAFAKIIERHPGLIVGQMQFRMNRYDYLTRYLVKIRHLVLPGSIADGWGQVVPISR